ncbi:hypothetical protein [Gluconobacter thailandicus]|uniref:Uncharacterized protein n=1 Tax=Gluconobacter thailandicus TaxID=257438 RepID=A0AAP9EUN8_GLUTH|nr:hypothetical protein [Gluconobacter thailandicus]QEH97469.1 hypothetical protein FXF46_15280 [Gluconobacter thailandicus]
MPSKEWIIWWVMVVGYAVMTATLLYGVWLYGMALFHKINFWITLFIMVAMIPSFRDLGRRKNGLPPPKA